MGGVEQWFDQQLKPSSIGDARGSSVDSWWPHRTLSADDTWKTVFADEKSAWEYAVELANWSLLRRTPSSPSNTR